MAEIKDKKLRDLGERYILHELIFPRLMADEINIDEDAVMIRINDKYLVINIDTFVGSTDAPPSLSFNDIGYKTVIMAASDVVAKGAKPKIFLSSISLPPDTSVTQLKALLEGIREACERYGIKYIGGDLGASNDVVITGACCGLTNKVILRRGARPGDLVWVTDEFGYTGVALHYLLRGGERVKGIEEALSRFKKPKLRIKEAEIIKNIATSAMDSSDGLAITLDTIARMSKVRIILDEIPIAEIAVDYAKINNLEPSDLALYAGEEFEIVFTTPGHVPPETIMEAFKQNGLKEPILIGKVIEGEGVYYRHERIEVRGWEHFRG